MNAIKNLLANEHGIVMLGFAICATVLVGLNRMTIDQWTSFSQWVFGIYAGATALPATAAHFARAKALPPAPAAPAAPTLVTTEASK